MTQKLIAELFGVERSVITKHLNNVFEESELDKDSTCAKIAQVQIEGGREVTRHIEHYNLDAIIAVGYRVNSKQATRFRQWATNVLREYLLRGYAVNQRFERLEHRVGGLEEKVGFFVRTALPPVEGIFFEGQIFDAYEFVSKLVKSAKKRIALIDNYVDETVLGLLAKRGKTVSAAIYTVKIGNALQVDIDRHNAQYPPIAVREICGVHDRFLIIDESIYHIGASIKDLGKKLFAFSKMKMPAEEMLQRLV